MFGLPSDPSLVARVGGRFATSRAEFALVIRLIRTFLLLLLSLLTLTGCGNVWTGEFRGLSQREWTIGEAAAESLDSTSIVLTSQKDGDAVKISFQEFEMSFQPGEALESPFLPRRQKVEVDGVHIEMDLTGKVQQLEPKGLAVSIDGVGETDGKKVVFHLRYQGHQD